jgi:hypothetical protein
VAHAPCASPSAPASERSVSVADWNQSACRPLAAAGICEVSGLDRIGALSVLALGGGEGQPHFLADCAGQEAAQAVMRRGT